MSGLSHDTPLRALTVTPFDTETTGLYPWDGDRVVSVAWLTVSLAGAETGPVRYHIVDPEREVSEEAARVHGITNAKLTDLRERGELMTWAEVQGPLLQAMRAGVPLAYNIKFDAGMVLAQMGKPRPPQYWVPFGLDPMLLARRALSLRSYRLARVAEHCGVELLDWHNAAADTIAALQIMRALIAPLERIGCSTLGHALAIQGMEAEAAAQHYARRQEESAQ